MFNRITLTRRFGILQEYKNRLNQKLTGTHQINETPKFFTTPARPSNFDEHLDLKVCIDNWFDENRMHNEADRETDIKRT
jgi:ubiquinol-cytochrome c reductase iron-sulfur subunit